MPSLMTKAEFEESFRALTKEERYRLEERIGNLCGNAAPTTEQLDIAWGDVMRFRWEN